jgi:hypothetical protein
MIKSNNDSLTFCLNILITITPANSVTNNNMILVRNYIAKETIAKTLNFKVKLLSY